MKILICIGLKRPTKPNQNLIPSEDVLRKMVTFGYSRTRNTFFSRFVIFRVQLCGNVSYPDVVIWLADMGKSLGHDHNIATGSPDTIHLSPRLYLKFQGVPGSYQTHLPDPCCRQWSNKIRGCKDLTYFILPLRRESFVTPQMRHI